MAGDVIGLMDHLGIETADIMGYSMGGFITAALITGQHSARFRSAIIAGVGDALLHGRRPARGEVMASAMEAFGKELEAHKTTKNFLQVPYDQPLPEDLIRRMAEYCVRAVAEREDDSFW